MVTPELQDRFQALLDEHKKILYKVCNLYCRNRDDRDDLAQEIVIQSVAIVCLLRRARSIFHLDVSRRPERRDFVLSPREHPN